MEIRINDLARELNIKSKSILDALPGLGINERKTHSSTISLVEAERVREHFGKPEMPARRSTLISQPRPRIDFSRIQKPGDVVRELRRSEAAATRINEFGATKAGATTLQSQQQISAAASMRPRSSSTSQVLQLPRSFTFHRGFVDFDYILKHFDWSLREVPLLVDLSACESANFQALALLIQYVWYLTFNGCSVTFKYGTERSGPTKMLRKMGAVDWLDILTTDGRGFGDRPGQTYALRRRSDVESTINNARRAIQTYKVGFPQYLSYIVTELLYNATEHGQRSVSVNDCQIRVPAIFQFGNYSFVNRLAFFFSDLGIGIKSHLEQSYPAFPTHQDAIRHALRPNVSGTFSQQSAPYTSQNNAGMGLTYSSLMLKRLKGDMYVVSNDGLVHISPEDITTRKLKYPWMGTFVLINLNVSDAPGVTLEEMLAEIRTKAQREITEVTEKEKSTKYSVGIFNYFGKWAEDKDAAINFRERNLLPAIDAGKKIELDFRDVETAPHSFLNALLATCVQKLGLKAYQWIRIYNAPGPIHEIIDTVIESNLPKIP